MTSTSQTNTLPPVPSTQEIIDPIEEKLVSQSWMNWFVNLRVKVNTVNVNLVTWSNVNPISGVTTGTYGDSTHFPIITVNQYGQVTNATTQAFSATGGVLPMVNGDVPPTLMYLEDGSLLYYTV